MSRQVGLIAAVDVNGIIGYDGGIPWFNKTDLKRFKRTTMNTVVIMGRKTYDSLPVGKKSGKKLLGRHKVVLSHSPKKNTEDVTWTTDWSSIMRLTPNNKDIWIIGGSSIYDIALRTSLPDVVDLTIVNTNALTEEMGEDKLVYFPHVPYDYRVDCEKQNEDDPLLWHRRYVRR